MKRRTIIFLSLIAVILLSVAGWNIYGWWLKHKLERYRAELIARGEKLTINDLLADYRAPQASSADYFLRSTARVYNRGLVESNPPAAMRMIAPGRAIVGWQRPLLIEGYGSGGARPRHVATNTWAELNDELQQSREGIALLHEVIAQPVLDFNLDYNIGPTLLLPHLVPLKRSAQLLSAAALSDLHNGDPASAAQHVRAILALAKGMKDERIAISQLVRIAILHIGISAIWELMQSPTVSAGDLKLIQGDLAEMDFINAMRQAMEIERAMGSATIHRYRDQGGIYEMFSGPGGGTTAPASLIERIEKHAKQSLSPNELRKTSNELLWQSALSYEDEQRHLEGITVLIESLREAVTNRSLGTIYSNATARLHLENSHANEDFFPFGMNDDASLASIRHLFSGTGSTLLNCLRRVEAMEANRAMVTTAIALKRFQMAHGKYPETLAASVPEFLAAMPHDPFDGQPLRYRTLPEGRYLLYCVGDNGVDEGGDASPTNTVSTFGVMKGRDWVWPWPATPEDLRAWEVENLGPTKSSELSSEAPPPGN